MESRAATPPAGTVRLPEIVPSRRDFLQFVTTQKQGLALIPRLQRRNPETGGAWPDLDLVAFAQICDDADVAALAVRTHSPYGMDIADLARVAEAVTAPVLRDDLCLTVEQIYEARAYGADAILVPGSEPALETLAALAASMHMAVVVEIGAAAELTRALALPTACIGLETATSDGQLDINAVLALVAAIPRRRTVLTLTDVGDLAALRQLDGCVDAAVVGDALLGAADPAAAIARVLGGTG